MLFMQFSDLTFGYLLVALLQDNYSIRKKLINLQKQSFQYFDVTPQGYYARMTQTLKRLSNIISDIIRFSLVSLRYDL